MKYSKGASGGIDNKRHGGDWERMDKGRVKDYVRGCRGDIASLIAVESVMGFYDGMVWGAHKL